MILLQRKVTLFQPCCGQLMETDSKFIIFGDKLQILTSTGKISSVLPPQDKSCCLVQTVSAFTVSKTAQQEVTGKPHKSHSGIWEMTPCIRTLAMQTETCGSVPWNHTREGSLTWLQAPLSSGVGSKDRILGACWSARLAQSELLVQGEPLSQGNGAKMIAKGHLISSSGLYTQRHWHVPHMCTHTHMQWGYNP